MSMLSQCSCMKKKASGSMFGGPAQPEPTLNDLLMRVGADFSYNYIKKQQLQGKIRDAQAQPGHSVSTPIYGVRGAIGAGLRAIADKYFTPKPLGPDNIPGYRRVGQ